MPPPRRSEILKAKHSLTGDWLFPLAFFSFFLALILGGAGDGYPLLALPIELSAVILIGYMAATGRLGIRNDDSKLVYALLILIVALPIVQLIPLPPELWRDLPGRSYVLKSLELSGVAVGWRPLSLNPGATLSTALEVVVAISIFLAARHLTKKQRELLMILVVAAVCLSAGLGFLQQLGDQLSPFAIYYTPHLEFGPGLQVNRNHQALLLVVAILLIPPLARARPVIGPAFTKMLAASLVLLLAAGVLITASRTGFVLLVPASLFALIFILDVKFSWRLWLGALAAFLAGVALLLQTQAAAILIERFELLELDERSIYWQDTIKGLHALWPVGSGIGTFPRVYQIFESVEVLGIQHVNNAHNDYLELLLEGGAFAAALIGLFFLYFVSAGLRIARRRRAPSFPVQLFAWLAVLAILIQSAFEFPLRMLTFMAVFGLLSGLIAPDAKEAGGTSE